MGSLRARSVYCGSPIKTLLSQEKNQCSDTPTSGMHLLLLPAQLHKQNCYQDKHSRTKEDERLFCLPRMGPCLDPGQDREWSGSVLHLALALVVCQVETIRIISTGWTLSLDQDFSNKPPQAERWRGGGVGGWVLLKMRSLISGESYRFTRPWWDSRFCISNFQLMPMLTMIKTSHRKAQLCPRDHQGRL